MNGIIATSDSFSVSDIPRSIEFEPFKILDHLINGWCERRALRPLRYLLDAYPGRTEMRALDRKLYAIAAKLKQAQAARLLQD